MAEGALDYFRAVAVDYDGTLANGAVAPDTLTALAETRARGIRIILVTGRNIRACSITPILADAIASLHTDKPLRSARRLLR